MYPASSLGEFLRSRRARVRPADVGLRDGVRRRRVPGLRREELAPLAGVSVGYYTRLEQGQGPNVSIEVLDAIARVLGLDDDERRHMYLLASPRDRARTNAPPERLRPDVRMMIDQFTDVPALAVGRAADVLAWNRLGHALVGAGTDFEAAGRGEVNFARQDFLDPAYRQLWMDWPGKARDSVGYLQGSAGQFPDDPVVAALIAELRDASPDFARIWAERPVTNCATSIRGMRHPVVGELTLHNQLLRLPDDPGQGVAVFFPEPGGESAVRLARLAAEVAVPA